MRSALQFVVKELGGGAGNSIPTLSALSRTLPTFFQRASTSSTSTSQSSTSESASVNPLLTGLVCRSRKLISLCISLPLPALDPTHFDPNPSPIDPQQNAPSVPSMSSPSSLLVSLTERGTPILPSDPSITGRQASVVQGRPVYYDHQGSREDIVQFPVYNAKMEIVRTIDLPGDIFNERIRVDIMHRYFVWQMAKRRQGTHKTKGRGEVRGGGRKPWPQKGTGRAPLGSIRAPQCRGGGHVKEKVPRDYSIGMTVKERRFGLRSALSAKAFEGRLFIFEGLEPTTPKTRDMAALVESIWPRELKRDGSVRDLYSVLLVDRGKEDPQGGEMLRRVARNVPGLEVLPQGGLQVRSLLKRTWLGMTENALWDLVERLRRPYPLRKFKPQQVIPWPPPPLEELEGMALPGYARPAVLPWMEERGFDPVTQTWKDEK